MNNTDRQYDIDQYLSGKSSEKERKAFEKKINEDASLREDVLLTKKLIAGLAVHHKEKIKQQLKAIDEQEVAEIESTVKIRPLIFRRWMQVAAAVVLLVGALAAIKYFSSTTLSDEWLMAEVRKPPSGSVRSSGDAFPCEEDFDIEEGGDWSRHIVCFEKQNELDWLLSSKLAYSYMQRDKEGQNDLENALHWFDESLSSKNIQRIYRHEIEWNRLLLLVRMDAKKAYQMEIKRLLAQGQDYAFYEELNELNRRLEQAGKI